MKPIKIILFSVILVLTYSSSVLAEEPSCEVMKEGVVPFSSQTSPDKIKVEISGKPCSKAKLIISVFNQSGSELYKFESPFENHIVGRLEDSNINDDAIEYANVVLESANGGVSSSLPEWKPEDQFYNENSTSVVVNKEVYKYYREQNVPVFWHPTYYEGWRQVVYDKEKKKAVVLLDGGL